MRLLIAKPPMRWLLKACGRWGICLPPAGVFLLQEHRHNLSLLRHEAMHWKQYQELGALRFYARYLWLLVRHGYKRHPMEIEVNRGNQK